MPAQHKLALAVQYASTVTVADLPTQEDIRQAVAAALENDAEIAVRFVDIAEGGELNHTFRGKEGATNVLTFVYRTSPDVIGDIALCAPVAAAEALEQGKPLAAHYAHLLVHGVLHLQGYDHEVGEAEAIRMEDRERAILATLGLPDPYTLA